MACADKGGEVRLFETATGKPGPVLQAGHVSRLLFSPSGDTLVTVGGGVAGASLPHLHPSTPPPHAGRPGALLRAG